MLINYLLFLGYLIGIWVVEKNFMLGLLYYFSIILIFQKYNRLELFSNHSDSDTYTPKYQDFSLANCNHNIPLYVTNGEFISIDLDFYQQCNEVEEKKSEPLDPCLEEETKDFLPNKKTLFNGLPNQKSIYIDPKIIISQKLHHQLKKGDKITIDGTPIDSRQIFTVVNMEVKTNQLKLDQKVPEFKMGKGTVTIYFINTHQTINNTIFDRNKMNHNIQNIDKEVTKDSNDLEQIQELKNKIVKNNQQIKSLRQQNIDNRNKIYENQQIINNNQVKLNNHTFYIDNLENNPEMSIKEILRITNDERNEISSLKLTRKNKNEELYNEIYNNIQKIKELQQQNINYQNQITPIANEMIIDSDIFTNNNQDIVIQNNNFDKFITSCDTKTPLKMYPKKKNIDKCLPDS